MSPWLTYGRTRAWVFVWALVTAALSSWLTLPGVGSSPAPTSETAAWSSPGDTEDSYFAVVADEVQADEPAAPTGFSGDPLSTLRTHVQLELHSRQAESPPSAGLWIGRHLALDTSARTSRGPPA